jgi:hypothetical protein
VVGDGGAGPAGGGRLDRSVDEIAEVGGFIAAGEGGLFDRTDGLAGWQQAKVVEVGDGVLGGNLAAQRASSGLGTPPLRIAVTLGNSRPCQR